MILRVELLPETLPRPIAAVLTKYRHGQLFYGVTHGVGLTVAGVGLGVLASMLLDRFVDIPGVWRAPLPWLALLLALLGLSGAVMLSLRAANYDRLAADLDARAQDRRDHLRTVLDLSGRGDVADFFVQRSTDTALRLWQGRDAGALLDRRPAGRSASAAAAVLLLLGSLWFIPAMRAGLLLKRFVNPLGNYPRPTATWLEVDPLPAGPYRTGDDLVVTARLAGQPVANPMPMIRLHYVDATTQVRSLEPRTDGRFKIELPHLRQSLKFHLLMGRARSETFDVPVLPRPNLLEARVTYEYPRYAKLRGQTETLTSRSIAALEGTRLMLHLTSSLPLSEVSGQAEGDSISFSIDRRDPRQAICHLMIKNQQVQVTLVSDQGVESRGEAPFRFRVIPDKEPVVSLLSDLDGRSFYLTDSIEVAYRAQDDLGLANLYVQAEPEEALRRSEPKLVELDLPRFGAVSAEGRVRVPLANLYQGESPVLRLSLLARDTKDEEGRSRVVSLRLASDAYDRQLRRLLLTYEGRPDSRRSEQRGFNALEYHRQRLTALRQIRNAVVIVADTLKVDQPIPADQKEPVEQLRRQLQGLRPPFLTRSFWYYDLQYAWLPPRLAPLAQYAGLWSQVTVDNDSLLRTFETAVQSEAPKPPLTGLVGPLEQAIAAQEPVAQRVEADHARIVLELVGYLATRLRGQLEVADERQWQDSHFLLQQAAVLREISQRASGTLQKQVPADALTALSALAENQQLEPALRQASTAVADLAKVLEARAVELARTATNVTDVAGDLPRVGFAQGKHWLVASAFTLNGGEIGADELGLMQLALIYLSQWDPSLSSWSPDRAQQTLFRLYFRAARLQVNLERLRVGLIGGELVPGRPQTESRWLAVREDWLSLLALTSDPDLPQRWRQPLTDLTAGMTTVSGWQPPATLWDAGWLSSLRNWGSACRSLVGELQPELASIFVQWDAKVKPALTALGPALGEIDEAFTKEIDRLRRTKDIQRFEFTDMAQIKARITALTTCALKLADAVQTASLLQVPVTSDWQHLLALYVGLGQFSHEFELQVEATQSAMAVQEVEAPWEGVAQTYEALRPKLAAVRLLLSGTDVAAALDTLQGRHAWELEWQAVREAATAFQQLEQPAAVLEDYRDREDRAPAVWALVHERLDMLRQYLQQGELAAGQQLAGQIASELAILSPLPREHQMLPEVTAQSQRAASLAEPKRQDLIQELQLHLERLQPLARFPSALLTPIAGVSEPANLDVDASAVARARWHGRRVMQEDGETLRRIMAALALQRAAQAPAEAGRPAGSAQLRFALAEAALNRRKAGLIHHRVGLGGVALGTDPAESLRLPRHLYLELQRSRQRSMPPLFRDTCYRYLDQILEQAR